MAICSECMIEIICKIKTHKLHHLIPCVDNVYSCPFIQDCIFRNSHFFFKKNLFFKNETWFPAREADRGKKMVIEKILFICFWMITVWCCFLNSLAKSQPHYRKITHIHFPNWVMASRDSWNMSALHNERLCWTYSSALGASCRVCIARIQACDAEAIKPH